MRSSSFNTVIIISGFFIHIVFLLSIFDIYFKSPIINGIEESQKYENDEVIAKRLVLFVADGLRSQSLFNSESPAPHLKSVMKSRGTWGISNTRVPTESRPGHVAIIAGFYEDPSAVARGWKENPVEFDSLFNRSRYTWSWGSPDILPMFAKGAAGNHIETDYYSHEEEDFSGKISTTKLDLWVFDKVEAFFKAAKDNPTLADKLEQNKVIFFLHLLGLDTAGHTHKPHSKEYRDNLQVVDNGIAQIEKLIEEYFDNDGKTSYIFTADHGMTDWGSHGSGEDHETMTPLIAWGAGIPKPIDIDDPEITTYTSTKNVNQADLCPLMACLLGIQIPLNSMGILPETYLDMSLRQKAKSFVENARQMLAQYNKKREITEYNVLPFLYKPFPTLTKSHVLRNTIKMDNLIKLQKFDEAIQLSKLVIELSILGLDYYQNYYQNLLLISISLSFLGWIWWLLTSLLETSQENNEKNYFSKKSSLNLLSSVKKKWFIHLPFSLLLISILCLTIVQNFPFTFIIYCVLPNILWWKNVSTYEPWNQFARNLKNKGSFISNIFKLILTSIIYLAGLTALVYTFFQRWVLSVALVGLSVFPLLPSYRKSLSSSLLLTWFSSCLSLAGFSFLPVIGHQQDIHLVAFSGISWFICNLIFLSLFSLPMLKYGKETKKENVCMAFPAVMMLMAIQNKYFVDHQFTTKKGLFLGNQILSWCLAVVSFIAPLFSSRWMISRLFSIFSSLSVFFILLSVSHEGFFLLMFATSLFCWLAIEQKILEGGTNIKLSQYNFVPLNNFGDSNKLTYSRLTNYDDFRRSYIFLLFIILSFFGTGNIASINSFDPQWVRCFVAQFSPFLMAFLILCKTLVPFLFVACTFCAVNKIVKAPTNQLFFIVLIFCDLMGLHFLYLVTNKGSWLDIGTSISHYVIMETTVIFISILYGIGQCLTTKSLWKINISLRKNTKLSKD